MSIDITNKKYIIKLNEHEKQVKSHLGNNIDFDNLEFIDNTNNKNDKLDIKDIPSCIINNSFRDTPDLSLLPQCPITG